MSKTVYVTMKNLYEINEKYIIAVTTNNYYEDAEVYKIFLNYRTGKGSVYKYVSNFPQQNAVILIANYPIEKYERIHGVTVLCDPEFQELYTSYRNNPDKFTEVVYGSMNLCPFLSSSSSEDCDNETN